jgi:hypothetical protein
MGTNADTVTAAALSGVIAHELNNIAVPLRGFIDLALQTTAADELMHQSFDEIHVGLNRIGALAYQLESLAQQSSMLSDTTIGHCLASVGQGHSEEASLVWACRQQIVVRVDLDHFQRALHSLVHLAGPGSLKVGEAAMHDQVCAACGTPFARGGGVLEVQASALRPAILAAIRAPFEPAHKLRTMQRLAIAALTRCTHFAGGHVLANLEAKTLSIVLPK